MLATISKISVWNNLAVFGCTWIELCVVVRRFLVVLWDGRELSFFLNAAHVGPSENCESLFKQCVAETFRMMSLVIAFKFLINHVRNFAINRARSQTEFYSQNFSFFVIEK